MSITITSPITGASVSGVVTVTGTSVQHADGNALTAQSYSTTRNMAGLSGAQTITVTNSSGDSASVAVTVATESAEGTVVTTTTGSITDASGNVWTLHDDSAHGNGNIVYMNGALPPVINGSYTWEVIKLVYHNHLLYQVNSSNSAWYWDGTTPWNGPWADPSTSGSSVATMPANTCAVSTTAALTNGTLSGATNVSKVNVHSLLYPGHTTKVLTHWLPWFDGGADGTVDVHYSTSDTTYLNNFMADLVSRGLDGVFIDWQGQSDITNTGSLAAQPLWKNYTTLQGGKLQFAIMLDANLFNNTAGANHQAQVMNAMAYVNTQYLGDANYLTYNGKLVVGDFGLTQPGDVNWATVQASYPNVAFVHLDNATSPDGFGITDSGGSFLWVTPSDPALGSAPNLSYLDDFYTRALTHTSEIAVGAAFKGFDAYGYASWDGPTYSYTDQQHGQTWLNCFTKLNSHYSSTSQLPFIQLETWDDYYEGTPLETGIDGNLSVTGTGATGAINSISVPVTVTADHLELYKSTDGVNGVLVNLYPVTTTSITGLTTGTYYIKVVGKPFIKNVLSAAISVA